MEYYIKCQVVHKYTYDAHKSIPCEAAANQGCFDIKYLIYLILNHP